MRKPITKDEIIRLNALDSACNKMLASGPIQYDQKVVSNLNDLLFVISTGILDRLDELESALRLARTHIIAHHAAHLNGWEIGWCPVCHKDDGTEPEMDAIDAAINGGTE